MSVRLIAVRAGVSPSTVSLALRGSEKISPETRERIFAIAREIDYRPDARIHELMARVRSTQGRKDAQACFGVMSLYPEARPWERSTHLGRIHAGMARRAEALGYRLEPLWLRAPGMTQRRFREILDARGIEGLVCFGSDDPLAPFPEALDHYAIVVVGLSIRTPLHRVICSFYTDAWRALDEVRARGYRRPGMILARHEAQRTGYMHAGAYLAWCDRHLGSASAVPVLHVERAEPEPVTRWLEQHQPDAIVLVHAGDAIPEFTTMLSDRGVRIPQDVGLAAVTHFVQGTGLAGMEQDQELMGARAVELLTSRIIEHDLGLPHHPRTELVESQWVDGPSLPRLGRAAGGGIGQR